MPAWLEVTIRSFAILAGLFLIAKLLGKKQLSKLSFFEYIVGITIGDIAGALSMELEANLSQGITAIVIWTSIPVIINFLSLKNKKFRDFVEGRATIFIKDGKIMEDNLKSEKYTTDELLEQLRKKDIFKLADVEFAVLESNGEISTLLKREHQPLTPHDMNVPTAPEKETQTVIMDGEILDEPLASIGQNRGWLKTELEKIGVSIENVFLGQVDSFGQLTVDLYDDQLQMPAPKQRPLLLASIKKCEADLELFALATENDSAKKMYAANAVKLEAVLTKVQTILKS
jgi:uncharacterized membrane protein YcaP (DUF421 family)